MEVVMSTCNGHLEALIGGRRMNSSGDCWTVNLDGDTISVVARGTLHCTRKGSEHREHVRVCMRGGYTE